MPIALRSFPDTTILSGLGQERANDPGALELLLPLAEVEFAACGATGPLILLPGIPV